MYKLYEVENDSGDKRYIVAPPIMENLEHYLDRGESIVTDCWLSDMIGCEPEAVVVVHSPEFKGENVNTCEGI